MPDARHAELEACVDGGEIELEVAVFLRVWRQFVGADVDLAPLEPFADVPDGVEARAPGREVIVLALLLAEPLAANPLLPALRGVVAIEAAEIELAELALGERLAALIGLLGPGAADVDLD